MVSLHIPYLPENEHFANDDFLSQFNNDIYVLNTARGLVLNTADLVKHLKTGKVRGAALDVLEYEKNSFEQLSAKGLPEEMSYLTKSNNSILSPHIAGWTFESTKKMSVVLTKKILAYIKSIS